MPDYSQITWLPLCAGLTVLGLAGSWLAWRRRGAAAVPGKAAGLAVPTDDLAEIEGLLRRRGIT